MAVKTKSRVNELIRRVDNELEAVVESSMREVKQDYENNTPVITGHLKRGAEYEVQGKEGIAGNDVEYAPYVEFGTEKMQGNHSLFKAAEKIFNNNNMVDIIKRRLARIR